MNLGMDKNLLRIAFADDDADDHLFFFDAVKKVYRLALINNFFNSSDLLHFFVAQNNIPPHIIFLDKNMPGNQNYECLEAIKNAEALSSVPVIIYSTSCHAVEIEAGLQKGAAAFITKPGDMTNTIGIIRSTINEYVPMDFVETIRKAV
jgi:DNA-binding NarL/FixJ family response regulator